LQVPGGNGEAVARGGNKRNTVGVGVGADQASEQRAKPLNIAEPVIGADRPRAPALRQRVFARGAHRAKVRRQVRGVEVGDLIGHVEGVALALQHGLGVAELGGRHCT
jgi:hypothetical protein